MRTYLQLLLTAVFLFSVSLQNYGAGGGLCGNDHKNGEDQCSTSCPTGHCPKSGDPFDPYNGNEHRAIRDLQLWGSVGEGSFVWMRYYNSRGYINWNYSYHYIMLDGGVNSQGQPLIYIHYPEGGWNTFTRDVANPTIWAPNLGANKWLFQEGNNFFLQLPNGYRYRFEKLTQSGQSYYQLQDFRDFYQNQYTLTYNSDRLLTRVTEPAGRYFEITYAIIADKKLIDKVTTSDGRSVEYNYDIYNDGVSRWIRFIGADYGDGTKASYTYSQQKPGALLTLEHSIDPRYEGNAGDMKFTYEYSIAAGYIKEERNGATGEVMATLFATPGIRKVCYANGRLQTFIYPDGLQGRYTEYTDGLGRKTRHAYDLSELGFLKTETDALGRVTTYDKWSIYANRLEITHPDGSKESWTRDDLDLDLTHTDALGRVTTYTRDDRHRVTKITHPDGTSEGFTYNGFGQVLTHTRRNGGVEKFTYDSRGLKTSATDALGNVTTYAYDGADRLASTTNGRGNTTRYEYNERGLLTKMINADDSFQSYTYDVYGNRTSTTNEISNTWRTMFDEFKRPVTITDPLNRVTTYGYDLPGGTCGCAHDNPTPTSITTAGGMVKKIEYDVEWEKRRETVGAGTAEAATTAYEYDLVGNLVAVIDPRGKSSIYAFNARNWLISTTDPSGHKTEWAFDVGGNRLTTQRPDGVLTRYEYDVMNRLTKTTNPKGEVTLMAYNAEDSLTALTDANGNTYRFEYDLLKRMTKMIYPDNSFEGYEYDEVSNLRTYKTRAGQLRTYTYDNRNREILADWSDATPDITSSYDAASRLLTLESPVSKISYSYDAANELTGETQDIAGAAGPKTIKYTYNADKLRNTLTYPNGSVISYSYTGRNQTAAIIEGGAPPLVTYSYDLNGNRTGKVLKNGTTTVYTYDDANNLLQVDNQKGGVSFARFDYGYNSVNNRTFVKRNSDKGDVYSYDPTDQVIGVGYEVSNPEGVPGSALRNVSYTYDNVGNRGEVIENDTSTTYTTNNLNQYLNVGSNLLNYNLNGDLISFKGWEYNYDAQNRLISAQKGDTLVSFGYDARNRRVKQTVNGTVTFFYYTGWKLIEERNENDVVLNKYVNGTKLDEIMTKTSQSNVVYYHYDALGSVMGLTSEVGEVVEQYAYDVFGAVSIKDGSGNARAGSAFGNRFLFTGREFIQEINLYDYRNRMYSQELGPFLQPDPLRFKAGDVNLYRYVENNPINKTDPNGLDGECIVTCIAVGYRPDPEDENSIIVSYYCLVGNWCYNFQCCVDKPFDAESTFKVPNRIIDPIVYSKKCGLLL